MTLDKPLPNHPLLISAIEARLRQNIKLMIQRCQQFQITTQNQEIHPWDLVHHQILAALGLDIDQNFEDRFKTFLHLKINNSLLNLSNSFLFRYELSGVLIRRRQYALALEEALAAEKLAFNENSAISSKINAVICQEALGFDISSKLDRIGLVLSRLSKKKLNPKIYSEYHSLCLRYYFREGRLDKIAGYRGSNVLYLEWLKHLPQLGFEAPSLKFRSQKTQAFYPFICNTILFRDPPEDLKSPPVNHWVNRLFLWTWTSLTHPEKVPIDSVLQILRDVDTVELVNAFTAEDKIMMCHCILLISLFDPFSRNLALHFIASLGPLQYDSHPYLRMERSFIDDLTAVLLGEPVSEKGEEYHRIAFFRQITPLIESNIKRHLPGLSLGFMGKQSFDFSKITIDFAHCRVWDHKQKKWLCSEGLALGFLFFIQRQEQSAVNIVEFMNSVLGIPSYDETIHYRNVYNILFRMKAISSGAFTFSIRRQIINFQIDKEQFHCFETEDRTDFNRSLWRKILSHSKKTGRPTLTVTDAQDKMILRLQLHGPLNRLQLQNAAGFSKAKTVRTLNKMIQEKKIHRLGHGKKSEYVWEP